MTTVRTAAVASVPGALCMSAALAEQCDARYAASPQFVRSGGGRIFYSGDTCYFPGFKAIGARLGPFDLALMENGEVLTLGRPRENKLWWKTLR